MKREEVRNRLIAGTIQVIANEGLDKATTKQIGLQTNINEAYIYRCFKDKDDLFAGCFDMLDRELFAAVMQNISIIYMNNIEIALRWKTFFTRIWEFMLGNRDKCLAFIRFYYSPYFVKYYATRHKKLFEPVVENMRQAFKAEADVWMIINHIFNVIIDFSVKVHNGLMPDEDDYAEHIFRVICAAVKQYFREAEEKNF